MLQLQQIGKFNRFRTFIGAIKLLGAINREFDGNSFIPSLKMTKLKVLISINDHANDPSLIEKRKPGANFSLFTSCLLNANIDINHLINIFYMIIPSRQHESRLKTFDKENAEIFLGIWYGYMCTGSSDWVSRCWWQYE